MQQRRDLATAKAKAALSLCFCFYQQAIRLASVFQCGPLGLKGACYAGMLRFGLTSPLAARPAK